MVKEGKQKKKRPTAKKRDIQHEKKRFENKIFKSKVRTAIRKFEGAVADKDEAQINETLSNAYALLDKGVKKGIFKLNKASRKKSRLAAKAVS